ncbi:MAG: hypothetical protein IPG33_17405 [Betaproteobacteria bacterium]|nr:hypothetical protein [Betaproteobacteria bacterium]
MKWRAISSNSEGTDGFRQKPHTFFSTGGGGAEAGAAGMAGAAAEGGAVLLPGLLNSFMASPRNSSAKTMKIRPPMKNASRA